MDYNLIFKITALIAGLGTTWKIAVELVRGRHGHLRDEYKFARDFLSDLKNSPDMHPFLRQKGYQAIAGDTRLSAGEIEYILTLNDSSRALKDFVFGRHYLQHLATATNFQIKFQEKYTTSWSRRWRKGAYLLLYALCYMIGFSPTILPVFQAMPLGQALVTFAFTALLFFPAAFFALRAGVRIARAEVLVKNQHKHTQGLIHPHPPMSVVKPSRRGGGRRPD